MAYTHPDLVGLAPEFVELDALFCGTADRPMIHSDMWHRWHKIRLSLRYDEGKGWLENILDWKPIKPNGPWVAHWARQAFWHAT